MLRTSLKIAKRAATKPQTLYQQREPKEVTSTKCNAQTNDLLRHFSKSAVRFWGKSGPRSSWLLSGIIFLILLVNLATTYGMNAWTRAIFDALQNRDSATILLLSIIYLLLVAAIVSLSVIDVYARMTTQRRWRAWLANHLINGWLENCHYYQLNFVRDAAQNPEYRILMTFGSPPRRRWTSLPD